MNDGLQTKQRRQAEQHIASIICRHACAKSSSSSKLAIPTGKAREVFDFHAGGAYSDLNVGFNRVRDRVYKKLRAETGAILLEKEREEEIDNSSLEEGSKGE